MPVSLLSIPPPWPFASCWWVPLKAALGTCVYLDPHGSCEPAARALVPGLHPLTSFFYLFLSFIFAYFFTSFFLIPPLSLVPSLNFQPAPPPWPQLGRSSCVAPCPLLLGSCFGTGLLWVSQMETPPPETPPGSRCGWLQLLQEGPGWAIHDRGADSIISPGAVWGRPSACPRSDFHVATRRCSFWM